MQPTVKRSATSDDEEDLESLRLAALQSLKRQAQPPVNGLAPLQPVLPKICNPKLFGGVKHLNKRGRGFHGGGRSARNGLYNNRCRNSNLISVQTVESEQTHIASTERSKKFADQAVPKLILPQDRYCSIKAENKSSEASSKFDRYNDSDKSDSDSESEDEKVSEMGSPKKLERANSLEALMQELENEIHGEVKPNVETAIKPKKVKKTRKSKAEVADNEIMESSAEQGVDQNKNEEVKIESDSDTNKAVECEKKQELPVKPDIVVKRKSKSPIRPSVLPNPPRRPPTESCVPQNLHANQSLHNFSYTNHAAASVIPFPAPTYQNYNVGLTHPGPFDAPMPYNYSVGPPMGGSNGMHSPQSQMYSPNRYDRPISPLTIKTDILNTISAPLSPRSAAFVLQNREIIERRKKSPRRSYSRSPTPEFRRSLSPRYRRSNSRSPSPLRQNRRASPIRRVSPTRRASPGVRRISPNSLPSSRRSSPTRYRLSPPNKRSSPPGRMSPKRTQKSPQRNSIRKRLGTYSNKPEISNNDKERKPRKRSRSISLSLSPSPERFSRKSSPINKEENNCLVDPVLEARKRKFEVNGAVPTEGIIRLKPKNNPEDSESKDTDEEQNIESQNADEEEANEEEFLTGDDMYLDLNIKVDDLFSDEESDSENEGRFKSNPQQTSSEAAVLPFTQLLNGPNKPRTDAISKDKRHYDRIRDRNRNRSKADRDRVLRSKHSPDRNRYKDDRTRERVRSRRRSRSPLQVQAGKIEELNRSPNSNKDKKDIVAGEKQPLKSNSDRKRAPIVSPIENKKIEIKIRNPAKYEVENQRNYDVENKDEEPVKEKKVNTRKVEVARDVPNNKMETVEDFVEPEPEIVIETEDSQDEDVVNKSEDAGDLRAQLSRKRAERQNKLPKAGVSSRILQNALQGAVFKKSKKSKSKKKDKEAAPLDGVDASVCGVIRRTTTKTGYGVAEINCSTASKDRKVRVLHCDADPLITASDGKVPIHLRLGIPGSMDLFTDSKSHKISRKRSKNRGSFDQV